ncbi:pterin-4-alpha-carbinolamine dehydratase [Lamprobacter modestohalophilus]|uniref:Pterin-4-alpha-carbinolamine dehydratase n=1 Tax=Lamprobacter modestohalophilus TaxID=1064514 RepID=A0A9X0W7J2_9GAMM|nr:pterin-4-alpha-carbinolamine dehydratase [Lamprobacter modestohalophilus]MCF7977266.1 pterin-4-alpha-carbinolamine dehydratase [Chromatiaceae bacterium]MBK1618251.1 pterin-4-alpha-carbinolamine dehydratase [Lamprobacter modestohalophilus]MCF7994948.1 pterin-4-alpha-carbinolamine dehydratase [Chromatiaceae bacterium]MCF8004060.1 pterin-4-alpha-carbinolamine dehydratase [Chromatiaceae bacterium]MCF8017224.1 pterin-4-alpha-carbinolamine dehydratase [Chromatiaceae bacterium]
MTAATSETGGHPWRERGRPLRLERRVEFGDYEPLRDFLDRLAELSEATEVYPNLSFGRTYANLTLFAEEGAQQIEEPLHAFAREVDALLEGPSSP